MNTFPRVILYFFLGALPVIIAAQEPTTHWHWVILACSAIYQGGMTVKALYSKPPSPDQTTTPPAP